MQGGGGLGLVVGGSVSFVCTSHAAVLVSRTPRIASIERHAAASIGRHAVAYLFRSLTRVALWFSSVSFPRAQGTQPSCTELPWIFFITQMLVTNKSPSTVECHSG